MASRARRRSRLPRTPARSGPERARARVGRHVELDADQGGQADDVMADMGGETVAVSQGEFIIPADVVSIAGATVSVHASFEVLYLT